MTGEATDYQEPIPTCKAQDSQLHTGHALLVAQLHIYTLVNSNKFVTHSFNKHLLCTSHGECYFSAQIPLMSSIWWEMKR